MHKNNVELNYCPVTGSTKKIETIPVAWELPADELTDKSLHVLRLIGLHLHKMTEQDHDKLIFLLNEILEIKPFKKK